MAPAKNASAAVGAGEGGRGWEKRGSGRVRDAQVAQDGQRDARNGNVGGEQRVNQAQGGCKVLQQARAARAGRVCGAARGRARAATRACDARVLCVL
eukprot:7385262-Prymnesium_polylepis.1